MRAKPRAILKRAFGAFGPLNCIIPMPIRAARFEDAQQIAEVHVASWQVAYRGILSDSLLDSLSVEAWTEQWQERLSRRRNDEPGLGAWRKPYRFGRSRTSA